MIIFQMIIVLEILGLPNFGIFLHNLNQNLVALAQNFSKTERTLNPSHMDIIVP